MSNILIQFYLLSKYLHNNFGEIDLEVQKDLGHGHHHNYLKEAFIDIIEEEEAEEAEAHLIQQILMEKLGSNLGKPYHLLSLFYLEKCLMFRILNIVIHITLIIDRLYPFILNLNI
jgi:hypothetical protein